MEIRSRLQGLGYLEWPVLCDGKRVADESNLRGDLEYVRGRNLARDRSWIAEAERGR